MEQKGIDQIRSHILFIRTEKPEEDIEGQRPKQEVLYHSMLYDPLYMFSKIRSHHKTLFKGTVSVKILGSSAYLRKNF